MGARLPLPFDELAHQLAQHLGGWPVAGFGFGHELIAQLCFQLHREASPPVLRRRAWRPHRRAEPDSPCPFSRRHSERSLLVRPRFAI